MLRSKQFQDGMLYITCVSSMLLVDYHRQGLYKLRLVLFLTVCV